MLAHTVPSEKNNLMYPALPPSHFKGLELQVLISMVLLPGDLPDPPEFLRGQTCRAFKNISGFTSYQLNQILGARPKKLHFLVRIPLILMYNNVPGPIRFQDNIKK